MTDALRLPSGSWTELELSMNARLLTAADREALKNRWKGGLAKAKDRFASSLLDGIAHDLQRIYLERRRVKTGMPPEKFSEKGAAISALRAAAAWCFDENVDLERLVACAEDVIKSVKFPTPSHLKGEFIKMTLPLWLTPEERRAQQRGDVRPLETIKDFTPAYVDTSIRGLKIDCPGLYDQES